MKKRVTIGIAVAILIIIALPAHAQFTFFGTGCRGSEICDTETTCTSAGNCQTAYRNCQSCGATTISCPIGVATEPNECREVLGGAECVDSQPVCEETGISEPHVILKFSVFTQQGLEVNATPPSQTGTAGSELTYQLNVRNMNPVQLTAALQATAPEGWDVDLQDTAELGTDSGATVAVRVTSPQSASEGLYGIDIAVFNNDLKLFGSVSVIYEIALRGAPAVSAEPGSREGLAGGTASYAVTVANTDLPDFDTSTITLTTSAPPGFSATFEPSSLELAPGESNVSTLLVTAGQNATGTQTIGINATANGLSSSEFVEYVVTSCGDGICQLNEVCSADCLPETQLSCNQDNGRCEAIVDDGVDFDAGIPADSSLVACDRELSQSQCLSNFRSGNCGDGACLCGQNSTTDSCRLRCVDSDGAYFLLATDGETIRSASNYSYTCPFVNLPDIIDTRDRFADALEGFEKQQSALLEIINQDSENRSQVQPCFDALGAAVGSTAEFVEFASAVVESPAISNTTEVRQRAAQLRTGTDSLLSTHCEGAEGILQISSISSPGRVEANRTARGVVNVENTGNIPYFGYTECDFVSPSSQIETTEEACTPISPGATQTFTPASEVSEVGEWRMQCRIIGSLQSDCSSSVHDSGEASFEVFTKDAFVVDVSGACTENGIICNVRTNTDQACSACLSGAGTCRILSRNGTVSTFSCAATGADTKLTGFVFETANCNPVEPTEKEITVSCPVCGDGRVEGLEQCELPNVDNSQNVTQSTNTCDGRKLGVRDEFGFCTPACAASPDPFEFSCVAGQCNAECGDGETRTQTKTTSDGSCTFVQHCSAGCTWTAGDCEVPGNSTSESIQTDNGLLALTISHGPLEPAEDDKVLITASASNSERVEIFVDGTRRRECTAQRCEFSQVFEPGLHTYFGRAISGQAVLTSPSSGAKEFTVTAAEQAETETTTSSGQASGGTLSLTTAHTPASPGTQDDVSILAIASYPGSVDNVRIFVDGQLAEECGGTRCEYSDQYPEGTHTYFAAVEADGSRVSDPESGTKSFTVSGAASAVNTTGTSGATRASCSVNITSTSCAFNPASNRYDLSMRVEWRGGDHAHAVVDGAPWKKMFVPSFVHTASVSQEGHVPVRAEVHNAGDDSVCLATDEVFCGSGTTQSGRVSVLRKIDDVVRVGQQQMKLTIVSDVDSTLTFTESVPSGVDVTNIQLAGSGASVEGPQQDRGSSRYTFTADAAEGQNLTLTYTADFTGEGEYEFSSTANYGGTESAESKTVFASSCPQINQVKALNKNSGTCTTFRTSCDVLPGWDIVDKCPAVRAAEADAGTPEPEQGFGAVVAIIAIIIILVIIYRFRGRIRDKLRRGKEEPFEGMPDLSDV